MTVPELCTLVTKGAAGYFKILFSLNLCTLFFQMTTKMLRQIAVKLCGPNYLMKRMLGISFGLGAP